MYQSYLCDVTGSTFFQSFGYFIINVFLLWYENHIPEGSYNSLQFFQTLLGEMSIYFLIKGVFKEMSNFFREKQRVYTLNTEIVDSQHSLIITILFLQFIFDLLSSLKYDSTGNLKGTIHYKYFGYSSSYLQAVESFLSTLGIVQNDIDHSKYLFGKLAVSYTCDEETFQGS